ncbi:MAG: hypothetical protein VKI63_06060 [Cyanobium sp.]|nr:hypothetical protein [Cyanobium sp.]
MGRRRNTYGKSFAFSSDRRLNDVSRPLDLKAAGIYPGKQSGLGQYGSTAYPTIVEAYNRSSDYKRWKQGMEYWFGNGKAWVDQQLHMLARVRSGPITGEHRLIATLFPSRTGPERAWHVTSRVRGSVIMPLPMTYDQITLQQEGPDLSTHRLVYDTRAFLSSAQLQAWNQMVGDQFEDSAVGPSFPGDLLARPLDSVALTLVEVDVAAGTLLFDLSRPFVRVARGDRTYWKLASYVPGNPLLWALDGSRHLCSSPKFQCSCPDYQGRRIANLAGASSSLGEAFPLPSANRESGTPWEAEAAGYYAQWRTLNLRADMRRECKHVHATRWEHGVPFFEPSDYPVGGEMEWISEHARHERSFSFLEVLDFYEKQLIGYDRLVPAVAEAIGLNLDPTGILRGPDATFRPEAAPILWNDPSEPEYGWCRQNDWWLRRGSEEVRAFSPADGGFSGLIGAQKVMEIVEPGSAGGPVIVR